jgi:hypothetical protein
MLTWIREKFGRVVVGGIVGLIALVFVFEGFSARSAMRGNHEGAVAGAVNGEPITRSEFARSLNQRLEFFKQLSGGNLSEEQIRSFNLRSGVFEELVSRKLLLQAARERGLTASDAEVRDRIMEINVFHKDGKFDPLTYKNILAANNLTPEGYEKMVREDLTAQRLTAFFRDRVKVTEEELKQEFLTSSDRRNIKYVLLTSESGRKGVVVSDADVKKFLSEEPKRNLVKQQFEVRKDRDFKGKKLEDVRERIARDLIAGERGDEVRKLNEKLAAQVLAQLKSAAGADGSVNALLKPYGVEVKLSGMIPRSNTYIPGVGDSKELMNWAFTADSGQPKQFAVPAGTVIAVVAGAERPNLAQLESQRESLLSQLVSKKERSLNDAFMKELRDRSKIEQNRELVGGSDEA